MVKLVYTLRHSENTLAFIATRTDGFVGLISLNRVLPGLAFGLTESLLSYWCQMKIDRVAVDYFSH